MHWLADQMGQYQALASSHVDAREGGDVEKEQGARLALMRHLRAMIEQINKRQEVTASFASFEGFLVHTAGPDGMNFEAHAAMTQQLSEHGMRASKTLCLGDFSQLVVIGAEHKLALFQVGVMAIGILAPVNVSLARVLS